MTSSAGLASPVKGLYDARDEAKFVRQSHLQISRSDLVRRLRDTPRAQGPFLGFKSASAKLVSRRRRLENSRSLRGVVDAFVKTCQRWKLSNEDQLVLLGYEAEDAVGERVLAGQMLPSSKDFKDRIGYVVGISLGLGALFGEVIEAELGWLKDPREQLNGMSSLDYMLEGHMANLFAIAEIVARERGL